MSISPWWYGIALFPLVLLFEFLTRFGSRTFIAASSAPGEPNIAVGIASFVLSVAAFWGGVLVALIVLGCLLADIRALGGEETWSPSPAWGLAGLVHLVGVVFLVSLVLSIPALSYYLYRRHDRIGTP
jgi:uncharacterized membrane protein YhaH (DUF805 family)